MFVGKTAVYFHRYRQFQPAAVFSTAGGVQASLSPNDSRQKAQNKTTPTTQLCFWIASEGLCFVFLRNCLQQNSLCRVSINFLAISFFSHVKWGLWGCYRRNFLWGHPHFFFFLTVAFADDPLGRLRLIFQMKVYFISVSLFKSTLKRHLFTQAFGG